MGGELGVKDPSLLGEPLPEWAVFMCCHNPAGVICGRDATWHGLVLTDDAENIAAMTESCDEHVSRMRQAVDYVHPLEHPCGIPGSQFRWPDNECFTEWDERAEFTQAVTVSTS